MKNVRIGTIALICALGFSFCLSAQQNYNRKESESPVEKGEHHIFGTPDHHYLVLSSPVDDDKEAPRVAAYDAGLKPLWAVPLPDLARKEYQGGACTENVLILFYADKDHNVLDYTIDTKTGRHSGTPATLFSGDEVKGNPEFISGSAPGNKYQFALLKYEKRKENGTSFTGVVIDQQLQVATRFSFEAQEEKNQIKSVVGLLGNDGRLQIVFCASEKTSKENYNPFAYTVVTVSKEGKTNLVAVSDLPAGDLAGLYWTREDNKLRFTGLLSRKKKAGFTAFVTGIFDPEQKKTSAVRQTELSKFPNMPNPSLHYLKDVAEDGIPSEAAPEIPISFPDGSRVLVYHVSSGYSHQSYFAGVANPGLPSGMTPSFSVPHLTAGNVYLLRINAQNEPQWLSVVPKDQDEPDLNLYIGMAAFADSKEGIHIVFYDETKNATAEPAKKVGIVGVAASGKTALAIVYISPEGKMSKTFLYNTKDYDFHLSPERSYTFYPGELLFLSIKTRGMSFTTKRLLNAADYRLGTITVK